MSMRIIQNDQKLKSSRRIEILKKVKNLITSFLYKTKNSIIPIKTLNEIEIKDDLWVKDNGKWKSAFCIGRVGNMLEVYIWDLDETHIINIKNNLNSTSIVFENKVLSTLKQ